MFNPWIYSYSWIYRWYSWTQCWRHCVVKWNNAEFRNVSSFTLLLVYSTHFTLSYRILLLALPTSNNFVHFVFAEIPQTVCVGGPVRPPGIVCFSGHWNLLTGLGWTLDFWYPGPCYLMQEVLCTHKWPSPESKFCIRANVICCWYWYYNFRQLFQRFLFSVKFRALSYE